VNLTPVLVPVKMKFLLTLFAAAVASVSAAVVKRDGFDDGQPYNPATGRGAIISGLSKHISSATQEAHNLRRNESGD
jgi:hypothetical protein